MPKVNLARTVRFCVNHALPVASMDARAGANTFAGSPAMRGLGAFYEVAVTCRGTPDPQTGYLLSVSRIDEIVRDRIIPVIADTMHTRPEMEPHALLPDLFNVIHTDLGGLLAAVEWRLTPFYAVTMSTHAPHRVTLTDRYEFAAAHRLHVDALSAEENRNIFGRCNNPSGHGHNYQIEVAASLPIPDNSDPHRFSLHRLQSIVAEHILKRFDHKHLNLDTEDFQDRNPSVENLAETCFQLLDSPIEEAGGRLERVTVWETEKTSCTYARQQDLNTLARNS